MGKQQKNITVNGKTYSGDIVTVHREIMSDVADMEFGGDRQSMLATSIGLIAQMDAVELAELHEKEKEDNRIARIKLQRSLIESAKRRLKLSKRVLVFFSVMLVMAYVGMLLAIVTLDILAASVYLFLAFVHIYILRTIHKERVGIQNEIVLRTLTL